LADLTLRPEFPDDALPWVRDRVVAEIRADREDPAYRAGLLWLGLIYGGHPFGRDSRGDARALSDVTPADIRAHHARLMAPDNGFLVAVGDFEPARLRSLLKTHLGGWRATGLRLPEPPRPDRLARPKTRRVPRAGEQVHVLLGHLGVTRHDPDYDALVVLDHILGTGPGFTDRLSKILRDELGLAYTVSGGIADSADLVPGTLRIYVGTGPGDVDRAVAAALGQLGAIHRGEFSDAEVAEARRYLAGAWVFDYQTVAQRAERLLELERWGLPLDEPLRWPDRIARVTPAQVRRAAARHLDPSGLVRVEYGPVRGRKRR
jgi:zinc protease